MEAKLDPQLTVGRRWVRTKLIIQLDEEGEGEWDLDRIFQPGRRSFTPDVDMYTNSEGKRCITIGLRRELEHPTIQQPRRRTWRSPASPF